MVYESGAPHFSIPCFTEHPMEAEGHLLPGNTPTKWHHMCSNTTRMKCVGIVISHKGIWDTDQKQIKSCHEADMGHQLKRKLTSRTAEERSRLQDIKWVMIPTDIALFRSMIRLPFETFGLMELMNRLSLSSWRVHPWSEVHCPQVDLKHHQFWACWLWQVVLCWGAGDPSLSALDTVSHSDKRWH